VSTTFYRRLGAADRIAVLGDALTLAGNRPHGFLTLLREAEDHPELPWLSAGRSGDRLEHARQRLEEEILPLRPTVLLVFLGVNDVWHQARGHVLEFGRARDLLRELAQCYRAGCPEGDLVFCTPLLIGEKSDGTNSMDRDLEGLAQVIREIAAETGAVDAGGNRDGSNADGGVGGGYDAAVAGRVDPGQVTASAAVSASPAIAVDNGGPAVGLLDLRKRALEYLKRHNPSQRPHSILTIDGVQLNRQGNRFLAETVADYFSLQMPAQEAEFLRHVVLLQFKPEASGGQVREVLEAFQALGKQIDLIAGLESGSNNSPEGLSEGFTHAFTLTFRSAADRDQYLHDPIHQSFVQSALPVLERVCVVDYWAQTQPVVGGT